MNTSGGAADQVVRMSLNGAEVAVKLSGVAAKQIAVMLYAILKDQKKNQEQNAACRSVINKHYVDRDRTNNKQLTQNVAIGLDVQKHRRNLNVLVCGGSGSGKTRLYAKPNIMQANTSDDPSR